jgi:hypothetical protein
MYLAHLGLTEAIFKIYMNNDRKKQHFKLDVILINILTGVKSIK